MQSSSNALRKLEERGREMAIALAKVGDVQSSGSQQQKSLNIKHKKIILQEERRIELEE